MFILERDKYADTITGGEGVESAGDTIRLGDDDGTPVVGDMNSRYSTETFVDLQSGTVEWKDTYSDNAVDVISEIENVYGADNGFDTIYGDSQDNYIDVGDGGSFVITGGGSDTIVSWADTGSGDTVSFHDITTDSLTYTINHDGLSVESLDGNTINVTDFENVVGTNYTVTGDVIAGDEEVNKIYTQDGNDTVDAGLGDDVIDARIDLGLILAQDRGLTYDVRTNSVYRFVNTQADWTVANAAALADIIGGEAGKLVTYESAYEAAVIDSYRPTSGVGSATWVGAQYSGGNWTWNDGGITFHTDSGFTQDVTSLFVYLDGTTAHWEPDNSGTNPYVIHRTSTYGLGNEGNDGSSDNTGNGQAYVVEWDASDFNTGDNDANNNNYLEGGAGADTIFGADGNDIIYGYLDTNADYAFDGANVILAGGGSDTVYGAGGDDTIYLTSDGVADTYYGNS
ncbi:MAG: hypothetical protein VXZ35_14635, partial [Pseudomonadota bacterium]|nr:hypothetical protein [Pseudomonadota bacterium]